MSQIDLMKSRLGDQTNINLNQSSNMAKRLWANGGIFQDNRMIFDKRRSLDRALFYSYQRAFVSKDSNEMVRALINPNKLKMDYDEKIISIPFESGFQVGDVFEWVNTNSYWLIYLQDLDELAYFRGSIRRCTSEIAWEDEDKNLHKTKVVLRGPVETKIDYIQKHGISVDNPNYTLNLLLPRTKENLEYFHRYTKFYLQNLEEGQENLCWRVEAIDSLSTPGILEVNAIEYYSNKDEDADGIVGKLIVKPIDPNPPQAADIDGDVFIKVKKHSIYHYVGLEDSTWSWDKDAPIEAVIDPDDDMTITIKWLPSFGGQFDLSYGSVTKTIVVESLF